VLPEYPILLVALLLSVRAVFSTISVVFLHLMVHQQNHWLAVTDRSGLHGSSSRPWVIRQTGPMSSGVTRNSGGGGLKQLIHVEPSQSPS